MGEKRPKNKLGSINFRSKGQIRTVDLLITHYGDCYELHLRQCRIPPFFGSLLYRVLFGWFFSSEN